MTGPDATARPDTSDMLAVHQVFRRSFGDADRLVSSAAGNSDRVALVADYYGNVLAFLEVHHHGEELLVFPLLRERAPSQEELVTAIANQHEDVLDAIADAKSAIGAWAADPIEGNQERASTTLSTLLDLMTEHLDDEEARILPLAAEHLSVEEWGALPGHGLGNFTGDKVWLILGLIRENMNDEQRAAMLEHMPPPAVEMWTSMGNAAFDTMITEVRAFGTA